MMVAVAVADADEMVGVDPPVVVRERLEAFAGEVLAEATNRPVQMVNGGLYLRGLIEQGPRKSLEPLVERLGEEADYHSMQQFLADSPWDPALVVKAVAERVAPAVDVQAWVIDDTGFPKDGKDSPGVKRQYSGTLGKTGNCQIGVSLHAVGGNGTVPLGWALYLPEEWCEDPARRAKAKIPQEVQFKTKPELGVELVERAAGWKIKKAPVLGDCAYGNNTELRDKLHAAGLQYVLSVSPETTVFAPETVFEVPSNAGKTGARYLRPRPDRDAGAIEIIGNLITHDRRLLLNLRRERASIGRRFVDDHAERRFQSMGEVADLSARALHHVAIGADQQIEFARKRCEILREIAFDFLGFAAPYRRDPFLQLPKRFQAIAKLRYRGEDKSKRKNRKGHDKVKFETRDLRVDLFRRRGNLDEINSLIAHIDDALDHAQNPVIGPFRVASASAPGTSRHARLRQTR